LENSGAVGSSCQGTNSLLLNRQKNINPYKPKTGLCHNFQKMGCRDHAL
jgi:hypothetical protein